MAYYFLMTGKFTFKDFKNKLIYIIFLLYISHDLVPARLKCDLLPPYKIENVKKKILILASN